MVVRFASRKSSTRCAVWMTAESSDSRMRSVTELWTKMDWKKVIANSGTSTITRLARIRRMRSEAEIYSIASKVTYTMTKMQNGWKDQFGCGEISDHDGTKKASQAGDPSADDAERSPRSAA